MVPNIISSIPKIRNYKTHAIKDSSIKRCFDHDICINKFKIPIKNRKLTEYDDNLRYDNNSYSIDNNNKLIDFS